MTMAIIDRCHEGRGKRFPGLRPIPRPFAAVSVSRATVQGTALARRGRKEAFNVGSGAASMRSK
jgi:hypothetical protein